MLQRIISLFTFRAPQPPPEPDTRLLATTISYGLCDAIKRRLHQRLRELPEALGKAHVDSAVNEVLNKFDSRMGSWMDRMVDPITHAARAEVDPDHIEFGILNRAIADQINREPRAFLLHHDWENIEKNFHEIIPDYEDLLPAIRQDFAQELIIHINTILHEESMRILDNLKTN